MSTSNSYNFLLNRDELITAAHLHIQSIGEGETPNASQISEASKLLNMLMKSWAGLGMPLWAIRRGYILPFTGSSAINTDSHVVTSYVTTTVASAASSGASTIVVASASGFADTYAIGVEQDDATVLWTTISGAPAGTTITLATTLTADVSAGKRVFVYQQTNRVAKPIRILDANIKEVDGGSTWSIMQISHKDFYNLSNRTSTGTPNQFYYDTASTVETNLNNGTIYIFPRFSAGTHIIEFTFQRPFQDLDSATDDLDCPPEFFLSLMVGLASLLGPKFGLPLDERKSLMAEARMYRDEALESIYPEGSIFIQPERRM